MSDAPKLVPLFKGAAMTDVPEMMRQVAAQIEAGDYRADFAVCLLVDGVGNPATFMWGRANRLEVMGALFAALDTVRNGER